MMNNMLLGIILMIATLVPLPHQSGGQEFNLKHMSNRQKPSWQILGEDKINSGIAVTVKMSRHYRNM